MNKYEPEKTELDVSEYAIYCALAIMAAFLVIGGLLYFYKEIFSFIGLMIYGLFSGLGYVISTVFQVTKPLNEAVGLYFSFVLLAISMWAFCVFHKIYDWFEDAKKKWLFTHRLFYVAFIISMIFVTALNVLAETKNYSHFYLITFFFITWLFKLYVALSEERDSSWTKEYIEDMKVRVRNSKKN